MPYRLTPQEQAYFATFGFVRVRGLFAPDVERLRRTFDQVFTTARETARSDGREIALVDTTRSAENDSLGRALAQSPVIDTYHHLNFDGHRALIPQIVESTPDLAGLVADPRIVGTATDLLGPEFTYIGSDGHRFDCDTSWHWDSYGAPLERFHIKILLYLDPLDGSSGALRVLPGTNHYEDRYASDLRQVVFDHDDIAARLGVEPAALPAHTVESRPGDMIVANFRTVHAAFGSRPGRRLLVLNFRQGTGPSPSTG